MQILIMMGVPRLVDLTETWKSHTQTVHDSVVETVTMEHTENVACSSCGILRLDDQYKSRWAEIIYMENSLLFKLDFLSIT